MILSGHQKRTLFHLLDVIGNTDERAIFKMKKIPTQLLARSPLASLSFRQRVDHCVERLLYLCPSLLRVFVPLQQWYRDWTKLKTFLRFFFFFPLSGVRSNRLKTHTSNNSISFGVLQRTGRMALQEFSTFQFYFWFWFSLCDSVLECACMRAARVWDFSSISVLSFHFCRIAGRRSRRRRGRRRTSKFDVVFRLYFSASFAHMCTVPRRRMNTEMRHENCRPRKHYLLCTSE